MYRNRCFVFCFFLFLFAKSSERARSAILVEACTNSASGDRNFMISPILKSSTSVMGFPSLYQISPHTNTHKELSHMVISNTRIWNGSTRIFGHQNVYLIRTQPRPTDICASQTKTYERIALIDI